MLLAIAEFAIEDGEIKNLTNTLVISKILILIGSLGALGFTILTKIIKVALYLKDMLSKFSGLHLFSDILAPLIFVSSLSLILYRWPRQSCNFFLSLRRWGLRSHWVKVLHGGVGVQVALGFWGAGHNAARL